MIDISNIEYIGYTVLVNNNNFSGYVDLEINNGPCDYMLNRRYADMLANEFEIPNKNVVYMGWNHYENDKKSKVRATIYIPNYYSIEEVAVRAKMLYG